MNARLVRCGHSRFFGLLLLQVSLLPGLLGLLSCTAEQAGSDQTDTKAVEIWKLHATRVEQGLRGPRTDDEFLQSCIFLKNLTGITISLNLSTVGAIPKQGADEDFERIKEWFEENQHRLYYDEQEDQVKVRGP